MSATRAQLLAWIQEASVATGWPAPLLHAQLNYESRLRPNATGFNKSGSIDRGIAQINNQAHPEVSDAEAYNPRFAIHWAAAYDAALYQRCGSYAGALQAYNSGRCNGAPAYAKAIIDAAGPGAVQHPPAAPGKGAPAPAAGGAKPAGGKAPPAGKAPFGLGSLSPVTGARWLLGAVAVVLAVVGLTRVL